MRRLARRLGRDERGLAAMEFAFVAPILIFLHLATVECVQAWEAYRRVTHIASAIADITAQNNTVTAAQMQDILAAGSTLIAPFSSASLGERVSSMTADASGTPKVDWSSTLNYTAAAAPSVPAGSLSAGQSVIVADVTYSVPSMFGLVLPSTITFAKHAYLTPRLSTQVVNSG
jgi:Flp pilus assembly protein TadG